MSANPDSQSQSQAQPSPAGIPGRRRHGFERPFDALQMATWALFPLIVAHYFAFLYFLLWEALAAKAALTAVFGASTLSTLWFVYRTCSVDPADDVLCSASPREREREGGGEREEIYCYLCEVSVHASSKHCRFCNKCVRAFDHHCKWLNTCVGEKNYGFFLGIVASVFLLTGESLSLSVALLVEAFAHPAQLRERALESNGFARWLGSEVDVAALQALLVVSVCVLAGIVALVVQLCGFHLVLLWKGMTTYDFIVSEQKKHREREASRAEKQLEMQRQRERQREREREGEREGERDAQSGQSGRGSHSQRLQNATETPSTTNKNDNYDSSGAESAEEREGDTNNGTGEVAMNDDERLGTII